jgi:hypothetical protein
MYMCRGAEMKPSEITQICSRAKRQTSIPRLTYSIPPAVRMRPSSASTRSLTSDGILNASLTPGRRLIPSNMDDTSIHTHHSPAQ